MGSPKSQEMSDPSAGFRGPIVPPKYPFAWEQDLHCEGDGFLWILLRLLTAFSMSSPKTGPTSPRILELDALRGLAAVAVVLFHYTTRYDQLFGHSETLAFSAPAGHYGVDLFFMLSGFVILMTLERTAGWLKFAWGRFSRLYPAYWAAAATTFAVVTVCSLPGQEVSLCEAVVNLTMIHALLGNPHIDGAYWSLQAELIFYINMLLLFRLGAFRRPTLTVGLWVGLAIACRTAEVYCQTALPALTGLISKVTTVASLEFIPLFGIGILLFASMDRHAINQDRSGFASFSVLAFCIFTVLGINGVAPAAIDAGLAIILYLAVTGRLTILASRPLLFLGGISYSLYLIHQNIGYVIIRSLEGGGLQPIAAIAMAFASSVCLASLLHRCFEKPSMKALRNLDVSQLVRRFRPEMAS